ncbi:MAG: arylesterase [Pseudomonadota bacterium]|nr:arylesterase [Pseudomonadota bacterium]
MEEGKQRKDELESVRIVRREFLRRSSRWIAGLGLLGNGPASALAAAPALHTVLVFGDSLSAGYGMASEQAWPALLAHELAQRSATPPWQVVNASISGETTHGGAARLAATLERVRPAVVILELGGNDALRGLPLADSRRNLEAMATMVEAHHARLLVVGVALPPNFGDDYTGEFARLFSTLAARHHAALLPNLVESLGDSREAFQADGIHPQGRAQPQLLASVMRHLEPLLAGRPPR